VGREREIHFEIPTLPCGNTPAIMTDWKGASPVDSFLASVQFSLFELTQRKIHGSCSGRRGSGECPEEKRKGSGYGEAGD